MTTKSSSANLPTQPPLAVVGLSALFPKASNLNEFWSNIRRGVDAITEIPATHWNPDDYFDKNQKTPDMTYARRGGFLSPVPFDPLEFGISPNNLEAIDTSQLLGMVGAKRALEHAGYGQGRTFDRSRVGCILGVTGTLEMVIPLGARLGHPRWRKALKDAGVAEDVAEDVVNRISQSYVPWQENSFPGLLGNVVAGRIANRLDLHGTNCVVDAACASSLSAIHLASLELWTGRSDMVVTGGIDTFNDIFMFMCFSKTPALSPSGDAKPFSDEADGTILGEGVGMIVLKRLADAERDGDRIFAVLKGIGTSSDGAGNAVYAPKAEGQIRCLQDAYRVSGVSPDTIELVEAHGTGTKVGDATEVAGLMQVFQATGRRGAWCAVGSIKSQIGHTKAAAGAAGVIKAILALQHRVLPPTIKVNQPPAAILGDDSPFYVNTEARPWLKPKGYPRRAAVSAFGFGGSNFHCVLEESPQSFDEPDWDGDVQVISLSAATASELATSIGQMLAPLATAEWSGIRTAAASSRSSFRVEHSHRLLVVIEREKTDLAKLVVSATTMLERYPEKQAWSTPDGAFYGSGPRIGKLGVLFPGQGSQYVGMLRELTCRFPLMSDVIAEANEVFASKSNVNSHPFRLENNSQFEGAVATGAADVSRETNRLSDYIYPRAAFLPDVSARHEADLRSTQIAQPAIGAVSLAVLSVLDQFGVKPEAAAGHSYGELTALCASRRFAPQVLYRLSMLRGQLMAAAQDVEGGMLAVGAPLNQIEAALKELSVDLVVANHNSPMQVVLSGRIPEIDRAATLLASRNIRGKKLSVAAAFHSPLVAPASRAFRPVLDDVEFAPSTMPVYANSTAIEYPIEPHAARDLLATQLARPVHFVSEVNQMYADGVRTFLEVGPGSVLTGLVNSILSGHDYRALAIDSSSGKRGGLFDLATALAQLSASGYAISWDRWDPQDLNTIKRTDPKRLQIPICGANYVKPRAPIPPRTPNSKTVASVMDSAVHTPPVAPKTSTTAIPPVQAISESSLTTTAKSVPRELDRPIAVPVAEPVIHFPTHVPLEITPPMMTSTPVQTTAVSMAASPIDPARPITLSGTSDAGTVETIRQTLEALQRMQQETSRLHQQFLEGQEVAIQTFARLADLHGARRQNASPRTSNPAAKTPPPSSADHLLGLMPEQHESVTQPVNLLPPPPSRQQHRASVSLPPAAGVPAAAPVSLKPTATSSSPQASLTHRDDRPDLGAEKMIGASVPAVVPPQQNQQHTRSAPMLYPSSDAGEKTVMLGPIVLEVVSEKTGYPTEMLNLEMSLDHDLGIDSIKRVEILSALQERVPNLPAFQPEELGSLHTLRDVVSLADARMAGASAPAAAPAQQIQQRAHSVPILNPPSHAGEKTVVLGPIVLEVVSEKTGYPTEMLNLEMSLDHDLGIDSIKRVEILSALQERVPNLPAFQPEELGSLHTLRDVVSLADARMAGASAPAAVPAQQIQQRAHSVPILNPSSHAGEKTVALGPIVLEVVSEKTGYPTEMLNLEMSLDHDLGIDSIKRVEILSALQERVPNLPAFQPEELGSLHTLRDVVSLADARMAGASAPEAVPAQQIQQRASSPPILNPSFDAGEKTVALGPIVLEVVSEKTGYPTEMLNLEMSLDHDLGIDSIKRVEILSALQERVPNLPAFQPEELGSLHTLRDVVSLADARMAGASAPEAVPAQQIQQCASSPPILNPSFDAREELGESNARVKRSIVRSIRLDPANTRPALNLLLGSDIWITEDGSGLSLRIAEELSRQGFKPRIVNLEDSHFSDIPNLLSGFIIVASKRGMSESQLWNAVEWLQRLGPALRQRAQSMPAFVATVSRLDGRFGFDDARPIQDPVSGGLAGLAKCVAREWSPVLGRAFDVGADWSAPENAAEMFVEELLHTGPVEVGLTPAGPVFLEVVEESLTGRLASPPIHSGDVVVVSGGARGVTAEVAFAIAQAWHPRLVILGRSIEPSPEPDWLGNLASESQIRQALIARAPAGTTPKAIAAQLQRISADREVARQLQRIRSTGTSAAYHSVDVRDPSAVRSVLDRIRREHGAIRGVIHGAGVLADQRIEDKTQEQFDRVYKTKVLGLKTMLDCLDPLELRMLGLFSSYTARFGRAGQLDYAIANEVLNKQARQFAVKYPQCRVASFNWGPWDGGMVQGGLKHVFAAEGVGLIPLDAGAEVVVREFRQTTCLASEILILANVDSTDASTASLATSQVELPAITSFGLNSDFKVAFERVLDIQSHRFLESHVLGGKAVLPVAIILEWFAHGAIHRNPGLELRGFDDFRVYQGIRVGHNDRVPLTVLSGKPTRDNGCYKVPMRIVGKANGRGVVHAAATVVLIPNYPTIRSPELRVATRPYSIDLSSAYASRLFHGPLFEGITAIEGCSEEGIIVRARSASSSSAWMTDPVRGNWLADPLIIDSALQAIILWSQEQRGRPCLPCAMTTYQQFCRVFPRNDVRIVVRVQPSANQLIRCQVEFVSDQGQLIAQIEGCESIADDSLAAAFRKNRIEV